MSSPRKKQIKLVDTSSPSRKLKREIEEKDESVKRQKTENNSQPEDIQAKKRKNFITACEIVSYKAYYDQKSRFLVTYLPACAKVTACKHHEYKNSNCIKQMPSCGEESIKIEMKSNMWREALEVCRMCITPSQYLSANVLKDVVEIMLNAHDDEYSEYTIEDLLDKCQQIFELNFSYHPPCLVKSLRKCYNDFLTTPMDLKENTFTNRSQFEHNKGVVKYCMNRLEHEISLDSKDEPIVDKYENIPEEMKQSVKGRHWQKEKFEIYELLSRTERIERIMIILDSIIELLQFDLAIWHSRYTNNLGCHIMRSHKPLMAFLLWSNNILYTGAVNNNCRQILRLFVILIHLDYPENHIKIMTAWVNSVIQTFYICENNSNSDYPNIGKYCTAFANEFYKILSDMPSETVIKVLERIKPDYMQQLIATMHLNKLLSVQENNPIELFRIFLDKMQWKKFKETNSEIKIFKKADSSLKKTKNFLSHIIKKYGSLVLKQIDDDVINSYKKFDPQTIKKTSELNHVIHTLYICIDAYLDAYSIQNLQETLEKLNEQLVHGENSNENVHDLSEFCSYSITEHYIKKYRSIYQSLRELILLLQSMRNCGELPEAFKIFEKIGL